MITTTVMAMTLLMMTKTLMMIQSHWSPCRDSWLLPHLFSLRENLKTNETFQNQIFVLISTIAFVFDRNDANGVDLRALHAQESEHGQDRQEGGSCVRDDVRQGVVTVDRYNNFYKRLILIHIYCTYMN